MKKGRPGKKIMCLNDCKIYETVSDAALAYKTAQGSISKQLHGHRNSIKGLYFISIDGTETTEELAIIRNKALAEKCNIII